MALSFLRRRAPEVDEEDQNLSSGGTSNLGNRPHRPTRTFPLAIVFLLVVVVWSTTVLLSGSVFHICVSSRWLNVYCISGHTGREFDAERTFNSRDNGSTNSNTGDGNGDNSNKNNDYVAQNYDDKSNGIKAVDEGMKRIRALRSSAAAANHVNSRSCDGRGLYVYDLPAEFNYDLMGDCRGILPWEDLCGYFTNEALGYPLHSMSLGEGWHWTYQYSLEPIFHNRVLTHPCRTHNPDEAAVFYVPFYGGLEVLKRNFGNVTDDVKDSLGAKLVAWLQGQPSWPRNRGRDHVIVLGRASWDFRRRDSKWGSSFLDLQQMRNPYKLLVERQPWELKDVGVPYPTNFHPHSDGDIERRQTMIISSTRRNLVGYVEEAAAATTGLKSELAEKCRSSTGGTCKFVDCDPDDCSTPETVIELFMESEFCLHPPADNGPSRRSVFESMVGGCIPVFFDPFTAYYQYPWHLPEDHDLYSVYIDQDRVMRKEADVMEKLRGITKEEKDGMRKYVAYQLMPGLVYGDSTSKFGRFRDAFGIAIDNVVDIVTGTRGLE